MAISQHLVFTVSILSVGFSCCWVRAYPFVPHNKPLRPFREYQENAMVYNEHGGGGGEGGDGRHSHVEGESYSGRRQELEAMGGDPFFLASEDDQDEQQIDMEEDANDDVDTSLLIKDASIGGFMNVIGERYATDGKGPTPPPKYERPSIESDWEWDGSIDEEAHLGLDDW